MSRVDALIRAPIESEGLELVHVEFEPAGAVSTLRVYIDKPGGVNISDCTAVSRRVGVLLDVEDLIPHHYTLEVSSPGIERPLFTEFDYERFKGHEVRVVTAQKIENRRNFRGYISGFANKVLSLECDGRVVEIPFGAIKKANLVYHFR